MPTLPDVTSMAPDRDLTPAILARLARLQHAGEWTDGEAQSAAGAGGQAVRTNHGAATAPDHIELVLAVDAAGIIRGGRFRCQASGGLLAIYDAMVELAIGRALVDTVTITPRQVENHLRGDRPEPAFQLGDDADQPYYVLRKAAERLHTPAVPAATGTAALPWIACGLFEKVRRIEGVLDSMVRPALASDGGGLDLVDLKGDELWVQYHGACGSCSSSIGGTLQFIQDSLNNHLGTALAVKVSSVDETAPSLI
ncbi:hypothetical protein LBMAG53_24890 [Planctomycetota bacterium]|nr:hypothetical protein LBMAG53_24890 [Planctomycetota bacterium]